MIYRRSVAFTVALSSLFSEEKPQGYFEAIAPTKVQADIAKYKYENEVKKAKAKYKGIDGDTK